MRSHIPMNNYNIHEIFRIYGADIKEFLTRINQSYSVCTGEMLYLRILNLLSTNSFNENNLREICGSLEIPFSTEYIDFLCEKIINDYNNFYLVDEYYNGYWYDENCYTDSTCTVQVIIENPIFYRQT